MFCGVLPPGLNYIEISFLNLLYPKPFIHFAKSKTLQIHCRNRPRTIINTLAEKIWLPLTHVILPNNSSTNFEGNNLNKLGIKTVTLSPKTICNLLHSSPRCDRISDSSVYCILCEDCKLKYTGETSWNIEKSTYKHRRHIRVGNANNALLQHISKTDHNLDCHAATMLAYIHNKRLRQIYGPAVWVCDNGSGVCDFIPGWVISKTQKMVLDASLLYMA